MFDPTPRNQASLETWRHSSPANLSGARVNAVGHTVWETMVDHRKRAHVFISSEAPGGGILAAELTYSSLEAAARQLVLALWRFERTALANWNPPHGTRQTTWRMRGWQVSLKREPRRIPRVSWRRAAGPLLRAGWTRYMITSIATSEVET